MWCSAAFCWLCSPSCRASCSPQTLIDSYILPLLKAGSTDFSGLAAAILRVAVIYCVGIAAVFVQNRLMARITQGTLKDLRDEMFTHMQTLPIKYFDTHAHGEYYVGLHERH